MKSGCPRDLLQRPGNPCRLTLPGNGTLASVGKGAKGSDHPTSGSRTACSAQTERASLFGAVPARPRCTTREPGRCSGVLRHGSDDASGPGSSEIPVADVSFDAAGDRVAMGDAGGGAVFWDLARREPVFDVAPGVRLPLAQGASVYQWSWFRVIALSPDGTKALLGGVQGGDATVWDVASGRRCRTPCQAGTRNWADGQNDRIWLWEHVAAAAFSPDGSTLLVVDGSTRAHLLDAATGKLLRDFSMYRTARQAIFPSTCATSNSGRAASRRSVRMGSEWQLAATWGLG